MNILILSCGTRDKVVQYFKTAFGEEGKVVTTDCSPYAPALYEGDVHYIVPRITEPGYIDVILDICKKEKPQMTEVEPGHQVACHLYGGKK